MTQLDATLTQIKTLLEDTTLDAAAKSASIHALTDPAKIAARALRTDIVADGLGDALSVLDAIGSASGLSPAEWYAEVKDELTGLADRYWNWLDAPDADAKWDVTISAREAVFATLPASGEAVEFSQLAAKLSSLSAAAIRAGLIALNEEGLADLKYGSGWFRVIATGKIPTT
ncbi:hypothetical protein [Cryobacterium zhongshanensis]|uniref:Uncharacterized protein n=1 Tax=Cryobacterium zhongshanensis TaxID=2928153 RepID=A0AA41QXU8_9MICO|nr:hypothetical protein [Cryobacterium zhongshanensis]MCI4659651.1 hypothetical protein [Cryobacterium zhongshanensis]